MPTALQRAINYYKTVELSSAKLRAHKHEPGPLLSFVQIGFFTLHFHVDESVLHVQVQVHKLSTIRASGVQRSDESHITEVRLQNYLPTPLPGQRISLTGNSRLPDNQAQLHSSSTATMLEWLDRMKENNARLSRWSLFIQPYRYKVVYRPGPKHSLGELDVRRIRGEKCDELSHILLASSFLYHLVVATKVHYFPQLH